MRIDGIQLSQGSSISNLVVASGTSFPANPDEGELFFRTDAAVNVKGLYSYIGGSWDRIASTDSLSAPIGANFPASANAGDLFYRDSNDANEGLFVFNGTTWVAAAAAAPQSFTVTGDVTGTLDGGTDVLTLANSGVSAGTAGDSATVPVVTVNAKGLVTSLGVSSIELPTSRITSGTFADARIAQTNVTQHQASLALGASQITSGVFDPTRIGQPSVTQHQAALSLAASQITSGTFDGARISQASVTQHQSSLSIAETQIPDGALLARVAGNETITGSWSFNNPIVSAEPSSASHLTTKGYVDNALLGLSWKRPARVATTANITLSGTQTIDGIAAVANDRVLVKNQSTASENGLYVVASGAWTRATDFDSVTPIDEVNSAAVFVAFGTTQGDTGWTQINTVTTVGSDAMAFVQFSAAGAYSAGSGMTLNGNIFNIGTASSSRIVVNVDEIDLALLSDAGTGSFLKLTRDSYGRVSGTTAVAAGDITSLVNATYVAKAGDTMTGGLNVNIGSGAFNAVQARFNGANIPIALGVANANGFPYLGFNTRQVSGTDGQTYDITAAASRLDGNNGGFNFNVAASGSAGSGVSFTQAMRITPTGNVGVGTTNPAYRLHVASESPSAIGVFRDLDVTSVGAAGTFIELGARNGASFVAGAQIQGVLLNPATTGYLVLSTLSTTMQERMRITSGGDVGIGTTTPTSYGAGYRTSAVNGTSGSVREFQINGATFGSITADASSLRMVTPGANALAFVTNAIERMRITSGGDVGIGTSPAAYGSGYVNLAVGSATGGGIFDSMFAGVRAVSVFSTASEGRLDIFGASRQFNLYVNSALRLSIDTAGNVGVGTASPSSYGKFSVVGVNTERFFSVPISAIDVASFRYDDNNQALINLRNHAMTAANHGVGFNWVLGHDGTGSNAGRVSVLAEQQWTATASTRDSCMQFAVAQDNSLAERMRLTSAGRLAIGTASPSADLHVTTSASSGSISLTATGGGGGPSYLLMGNADSGGVAGPSVIVAANRIMSFGVGDSFGSRTGGTLTEYMRLTAGGDFLVGTTSTTIGDDTSVWFGATRAGGALANQTVFHAPNNAPGSWILAGFYRGASQIGSIQWNGTGVSYVTTSDARLKENIVSAASAGAIVDAIQVREFDYIAGGHVSYGVVAQELNDVMPDAVSAGSSDGDEISSPWSVDYSKLVPMLVKEIQELRARVAALESA